MKSFCAKFLIFVVLLSLASPASARDRRDSRRHRRAHSPSGWIVSAGAGMPSYALGSLFLDGYCYRVGYALDDPYYNSIGSIYSPYHNQTRVTGPFSIGVAYKFNHWFAVSADVTMAFIRHDMFDVVSHASLGPNRGFALMLVPKARFYYMDRPYCRLYGTLGIGVAKYFGYDKLSGVYVSSSSGSYRFIDDSFRVAGEYVPFGLEYGRKFFGFLEVGIGTEFTGLRAGVGYKF